MTLLLYLVTVVVWGSTWYAMLFQIGQVAPAASLTYRYLGAGLILLAGALAAGKSVRLTRAEHLWCAGQGVLMFSFSYWLTYNAAAYLTTGIIAVMFSATSAVTMLLSALAQRALPEPRAMLGAGLGVAGIAFVFWPEIASVALDGPEVRAGLMVALSVLLFSAGGLVGARNQASGMPRFATLGWAMIYGGLVMAALTLASGERFAFEWTLPYVASLLYLTVLGSAAIFVLYFTVIERIGAEKASYAAVLYPLVALAISTVFEDYHWPALALIGVPLALAGNALVLTPGRRPARLPARLPASGQGGPGEAEALEAPPEIVDLPKRDTRR